LRQNVVAYKLQSVPTVEQTDEFADWLAGLRDIAGKAKVLTRIRRMEAGNAGDAAPIGDGLSEMRIHASPGYRVYYRQRGDVAVLLCGGDKDTQQRDIAWARAIAADLED
jgi:putative addiction module killer protein